MESDSYDYIIHQGIIFIINLPDASIKKSLFWVKKTTIYYLPISNSIDLLSFICENHSIIL